MRLPFFRPKAAPEEGARPGGGAAARGTVPVGDEAAIAAARTQARRRLVGAVVLLVTGVIGFALLFETEPRPLPMDTPFLVPDGRVAGAPVPAGDPRPLPVLPDDAGVEPVAASASAAQASPPAPAPAAVAPVVSASPPVPATPSNPSPTTPSPTPAATATPPRAPAPAPPAPTPPAERTAAAAPAEARVVVQVGAYTDLERLQATRTRLERMGYRTYTQPVDTPSGRRTRLRIGPFDSRAEADAVARRVQAAGLQAAVLTL